MRFSPKGVVVPIITPLTKEYKVNIPALCKLIDFLIDGGVHGIFAAGTTGEFYYLTNEEHQEIVEATVDHVKGRTPVYAGISSISTRQCINLAKIAEKAGANALTSLPPFYISLTQNEIYEHFAAIAANTSLPIILYDNTPKTHLPINPATVERLAKIPNIVALKDSTGDLTNTADVLNRTKGMDFQVLIGKESLFHAGLCYGASGTVAGTSNVAPKLVSSIYNKYISGDIAGSLEDQYKLLPLRLAYTLGSFPAVIKESLGLMGIDVGPCAPPTKPMSADEKEQLKKILKDLELIK